VRRRASQRGGGWISSGDFAGTVVASEADAIDPADHLGWSVTVVGMAHQVTDPAVAVAFRRALHHWAGGANDQIISISPGMVSGFGLVAEDTAKAMGWRQRCRC